MNGDSFLSFNMLNEIGEGRFFLGHVIDSTFGTVSSAGPNFISFDMAPIPLPAGGALLIAGLGIFALMRWRTG